MSETLLTPENEEGRKEEVVRGWDKLSSQAHLGVVSCAGCPPAWGSSAKELSLDEGKRLKSKKSRIRGACYRG